MACDILDIRCLFVNEIVGNVVLTVVLSVILYFIIASKLRFGFDTTIALFFPMLFIFGLTFAGFSAILAFATVIIGIMIAFIFNKIVGNR